MICPHTGPAYVDSGGRHIIAWDDNIVRLYADDFPGVVARALVLDAERGVLVSAAPPLHLMYSPTAQETAR